MGFSLAYFVACSLACIGILQLASISPRSRYLQLFKLGSLRKFVGLLLIFASILLFFLTGDRVISDHEGGLDANQQAIIFSLSALFSYIFCAVVSQLILKVIIKVDSTNEITCSPIHKKDYYELTFSELQEKNWSDFKVWITQYFKS